MRHFKKKSLVIALNISAIGLLSLSLQTCSSNAKPKEQVIVETTTIATGDNSRNSLDWDGIYKGITPCADCEGIKTELTLNRDGTYKRITSYLGKPDTENIVEVVSTFKWNDAGNIITLEGLDPEYQPTHYQVGEGRITQLDLNGERITGTNAEKYILHKAE